MVTFESDGSLTFRVYLPHADSVSLIGDFTSWSARPIPLRRERPMEAAFRAEAAADPESLDHELADHLGWWCTALRLDDGDHAFSYLVDNQWWLPDYAAHGVRRNAEGNWASLLFVPPTPRILERLGRRHAFDRTERLDPAIELAESPARLEALRARKIA